MNKITKPFIAVGLLLLSQFALATTPAPTQVEQTSTPAHSDNNFTYPDIYIDEQDLIVHDVVFFYGNDVLDYFDGDTESLVAFIEQSVEVNNTSFFRQNIPLKRRIAGIVQAPDGRYDNLTDQDRRLTALRSLYQSATYDYQTLFDVSYVVGVNQYYPDENDAVGMAGLTGQFSWISPYSNKSSLRTLSHELAHNDGFTHSRESFDGHSTITQDRLAAYYAIGASCNRFSSFMDVSSSNDRSEFFFSSPDVKNASGTACGTHDESDAQRAYQEAINNQLANKTHPFTNNKDAKVKSGHASLYAVAGGVSERTNGNVSVDVVWQDAEMGDSVLLIIKKGTASTADFTETMKTVYYEGQETTPVTFGIFNDDIPESEETFSISMIHSYGINIGDNSNVDFTIYPSDGVTGKVGFAETSLSVNEGATLNVVINRSSDSGEMHFTLTSKTGTADQEDFDQINTTVSFMDGETEKRIPVKTVNDTLSEGSETFTLELSGDSDLLNENSVTTITINASDNTVTPPPTNTNNDSEGGGGSAHWLFLLATTLLYLKRKG